MYAPKLRLFIITTDGERVSIETAKRVKEWFWTTITDKINLAVRYGSKTLELSTGDELIFTLSLLKDAVTVGELDDAITNASDKLRSGFSSLS